MFGDITTHWVWAREGIVALSTGGPYLSVNQIHCENTDGKCKCGPAIRKLPLFHTQPLRSDTTRLLPESPLSKHKCVGSFCSKARDCKSVQGMPNPSPRPSLHPSLGRALGPCLPHRGDSCLWAPWCFTDIFFRSLIWPSKYICAELNIEATSAEGRHAHSFIFIRPSHLMIQCMGHRPTAPLPLESGLLT